MVIGKLSAILSLNSSSFDTRATKSARSVRTLRNEIEQSAGVVPRLKTAMTSAAKTIAAAGAAATAAAVGGFYLLRNEMERLDKIGKTASKLGMAPEALVGLQHTAGLAGIETNKLDMALQRMTRRLAEAAHGGGEAQTALAELRLDASRLASLSPDQAILEIADAMAGVANQGDRVRLAFKLFDAEGVDLLRMMQDGSTSIRQAMADAEQLGLTFSKLDAAKVAAANDAMSRLKDSTGALKTALAIELAPVVATIADDMTTWLTSGSADVRGLAGAIGTMVEAGAGVVDIFRGMEIHWAAFQAVVIRGAAELAGVLSRLPGMDRDYWTAIQGSLMEDFRRYNAMVTNLEKQDWAKSIRDQVSKLKQDLAEGGPSAPATDLADLEALQEQQRTMDELQRKGEAMAAALRTPQEVLRDRIADANKMLDLGAISWQTYGREIAAARAEFLRTQEAMSGLPALLEEGSQAFYKAQAEWNASQRQMKQPLPGDDMVRDRNPAEASVFGSPEPLEVNPFLPELPPLPEIAPAPMDIVPKMPELPELRVSMAMTALPKLGRPVEQPEQIGPIEPIVEPPEDLVIPTATVQDIILPPIEISPGVFEIPGGGNMPIPEDQVVRVMPTMAGMPKPETPEAIRQRVETDRPVVPQAPMPEPIRQRIEADNPTISQDAAQGAATAAIATGTAMEMFSDRLRGFIRTMGRPLPSIELPVRSRRVVTYDEPAQRERSRASDAFMGRDNNLATELKAVNKNTAEALAKLNRIAASSEVSEGYSQRTASGIERFEMPAVADF